jgi:predicted AlkP superfamily phosphohydrolase/phosphomutase
LDRSGDLHSGLLYPTDIAGGKASDLENSAQQARTVMTSKKLPQRVLVIGLDVGDANLIFEWSQRGLLPVFETLISGGARGVLRTTADILHVSAWPSLYTGTLPGKHGVYYTFQPAPGQQGVQRFGPDQYGQPPVWQILSAAGKRCTIFDAPYTHPVRDFHGVQIFEWGTWAWYWHPMSEPPRLMRQMTGQCGAYPLGFEANQVGLRALDLANLHQRLIKAATAKANAVRWLMANQPWDMFWVVFGETHPAAHYLWPSAKGTADSEASETMHQKLRDVYQAIDRAIGRILEGLGEEVAVFIISGDGVGPNYAAWHLLPEVLQRLGFTAALGAGVVENQESQGSGVNRQDLVKMFRDLVPSDLRQKLSQFLPTRWRDSLMSRWTTANIDWAHTRAFCLPTDLEGCIRLNVRGREPQGIVQPGSEYEEVCHALAAALRELVNPRTGRPVVQHIVRTDTVFPGERRHYLPDLVVLWADDAEIHAVRSPKLGMVQAPSPDARTGTHRPPGFVIARGPSIPSGYLLAPGHIVDFAPTILTAFGLRPPEAMDGEVWDNLWASSR